MRTRTWLLLIAVVGLAGYRLGLWQGRKANDQRCVEAQRLERALRGVVKPRREPAGRPAARRPAASKPAASKPAAVSGGL